MAISTDQPRLPVLATDFSTLSLAEQAIHLSTLENLFRESDLFQRVENGPALVQALGLIREEIRRDQYLSPTFLAKVEYLFAMLNFPRSLFLPPNLPVLTRTSAHQFLAVRGFRPQLAHRIVENEDAPLLVDIARRGETWEAVIMGVRDIYPQLAQAHQATKKVLPFLVLRHSLATHATSNPEAVLRHLQQIEERLMSGGALDDLLPPSPEVSRFYERMADYERVIRDLLKIDEVKPENKPQIEALLNKIHAMHVVKNLRMNTNQLEIKRRCFKQLEEKIVHLLRGENSTVNLRPGGQKLPGEGNKRWKGGS